MIHIERGEWFVIRVDGSIERKQGKPTIPAIYRAIGCEHLDTVILSRSTHGAQAEIVMLVDDTGVIDGKPVNPKATRLYHAVRDTPHSIHGDVAIARDEDFE